MTAPGGPDPLVRLICAQGDIANRYSHLKPLRDSRPGRFSLIFEAIDSRNGENVVLKFLHPGERDEYRKKSFGRESQILKEFVGKENIVQIRGELVFHPLSLVDPGTGIQIAFDLSLFALERGSRTLTQYLLRRPEPAPLKRRLEIARDVAKGVNRLHSNGYCHRDLKPDNVLLFPGGHAKLIDLGTCRRLDGSTHLIPDYFGPVGDIRFSAPETLFGSGNVTAMHASADWFSFGAVLFEVACGVNLYVAIGLRNEDLLRMMQQYQHLPASDRIQQFARVVQTTAGKYPIPSVREFRSEPWLASEDDETIAVLDDLLRDLCDFDYSKRLTSFGPVLRRLDICLGMIRTTQVRASLRHMRGK